ncbi:MAG TPA: carbamoyl-phosphate synthase large subunit [Chloroflexota bacterium]|nr:carbamoyl-phosphate synthase large subunit [Chloroflexota bacterium]
MDSRGPTSKKPVDVRKVLVIGSGPIVIGQAAEFDYAGTQACTSLREEGVSVVLINSNPATIMTDVEIADAVYIEPPTVPVIERIIRRERPDGLLPTLGGQTGLNLAVELAEAGVLDRHGVELLGTPLDSIRKAEDRELFKELLIGIGEPVPESEVVSAVDDAVAFAERLSYPVVVRPAFTLGGTGGGIGRTEHELRTIVAGGLAASPIHQVLVERSLIGWKEIEYEVMRDGADNCITICNMENLDPMGVHTGDSIVVAPSQTLSDFEYQMLRTAAIKIIRSLGIRGGCNVQFALDPHSFAYFVIEVNPRVSRSSALASKATGYPIARVAAKIAIGRRLDEIPNAVTGKTTAAFEPALDYVVMKVPRWPFDKFATGDRTINTQMKSTGEVMAIGRSIEAALQKAVRSLENGGRSLLWEERSWSDEHGRPTEQLFEQIRQPNDLRLWALAAALRRDVSVEQLAEMSGFDPFFLHKIRHIVAVERELLHEPLTPALMFRAKRMGFSDSQIGTLADLLPEQVRALRIAWNIRPVYKMVDTCAAEFAAVSPYFYSTYEEENEAAPLEGERALVIGSGPIRIGQGIEFDYCSVRSATAQRAAGVASIMVNSNPETVSTDFDASTRLYFEPLDEESVRDLLENEAPPVEGPAASSAGPAAASPRAALDGDDDRASAAPPVIVQFGGQTAINLAEPLRNAGFRILGTSVESIDLAEDRRRFEEALQRLDIPQPPGGSVRTVEEALNTAERVGYPVLVRPSYVLGGRAMEIVHSPTDLIRYVTAATQLSTRHPVLIDKYLEGRELEVDAICDGEHVLIPGVMEHVERAGVHSGDSMAVYPAVELTHRELETVVDYTTRLGVGLGIVGIFNVQYVLFEGTIFVLEVNPRASRTVPFLSKATGVPIVTIATRVMLGESLRSQGITDALWPAQKLVAVKAPVFSMAKLPAVDTYLGPEMKSTGEVMGIDLTYQGAMVKALTSAGLMLPPKGALLISVADRDKAEAIPIIRSFARSGHPLYATEGTAGVISALGLPVVMTTKKLDEGHPNVLDVIMDGSVTGVINTLEGVSARRDQLRDGFEIRRAATERRIPCYTSLDTARVVAMCIESGASPNEVLPVEAYWSFDPQSRLGPARANHRASEPIDGRVRPGTHVSDRA